MDRMNPIKHTVRVNRLNMDGLHNIKHMHHVNLFDRNSTVQCGSNRSVQFGGYVESLRFFVSGYVEGFLFFIGAT